MKYLFILLALIFHFALSAQKLSDVQWSNWIAINDRNENEVLFSFAYAKFGPPNEVDEKRTGLKWYFRIKNDYKEDISGRFVYEYSSTDGKEHINSYIIHCMPAKTNISNELLFVTNVEKLTNIFFVEFHPCSPNSSLTSFTIKDTALFRLQDAMIVQQKLRVQSGNSYQNANNTEASSSSGKTIDFSDKTIIYKGKNEEIIKKLLSSVKGWRTNSGLQIQDGIPPEVPVDNNCQRDQYVYSAILYAWAAESYYRINELKKAEEVSDKIPSLINLVTQLCGGGVNYVNGKCKTAFIFPCNETNNNSTITAQESVVRKDNKKQNFAERPKTDMEKEKELLYSLLPLASTGFNPRNADFTNAFSGFMSKFDSYVDDDTTLGTGVKFFIKLGNLHTMSQLRELSGDNVSYSNFLQKIGATDGRLNGNFNQNYNLSNSLSTNKPLSQMSTAEMRTQIEPLWNTIGSLIEAGNDENGLTVNGENKITERYEEEREQNQKLKAAYDFDMEDLKYAIRNFDDQLLDKILSTNFPIGLQMSFSQRNESDEQAENYTYENFGHKKFAPKPVHYAAKYGNVYALRKLIAKGADINEKGKFHNMYGLDYAYPALLTDEFATPLFIALAFNRYEAVKLLCEITKEPFPKKSSKNTALDIARAWKNDEMVDLIKNYIK